ncbi:MAG TPA: TonB-dependent receptor, partial [Sphingomonas sp.]
MIANRRRAMVRSGLRGGLAIGVLAYMLPGVSLAQTAPAGTAPAPAAANMPAGEHGTVDDIVVTALKRSEPLQNVGATIEALPAETLRTARFSELKDLSSYAPNVDIKETVPGALPTVTVRGIGLDDFSTVSSPAAGVYVDEVPLSSAGLMSGDLFDLQRIEVLKGPQGTLYGRNTSAGAINILSALPDKDFAFSAKASYGNFQAFDAEAMLNLPLAPRAQLRLSAKTIQQAEGFWTSSLLENGTPGKRNIGSRDIWLGRAQLALQPTDNLDILLKVEGERSRSEMGVPQFNGTFGIGTPFVPCAAVLAGRLDNNACVDVYGYRQTRSDPYKGDWVGSFPYRIDQVGLLSKIRYRVGGFELTSITGYIDFKRLYHIDVDATPRQEFDYIENEGVRQFTQELRIGRETKVVDIIAGGFYSWDRVLGNNINMSDQWPLLLFG